MALGGVLMNSVTELGSNGRKALMTSEVGTSQDAGFSLGALYRVRPPPGDEGPNPFFVARFEGR